MECPQLPLFIDLGETSDYISEVQGYVWSGILMNKTIIIVKIPSFGRKPNHKAMKKSHQIGERGGIRYNFTKEYIF